MFRRSNQNLNSVKKESVEDKADRLLKIVANSPYHLMKNDGDRIGHGYRWVFKIAFLRNVSQENGFNEIMYSKYFSEIEKDFLLFNINRLKEISEWSCERFNNELKEFKKDNNV